MAEPGLARQASSLSNSRVAIIMKPTVIDDLLGVLPSNCVLHATEDLRPYECDGLSAYRQLPLAVALPETIEQVRAVMQVCHRHRTPVVARGAGTGLSGGALPLSDGVLLGLAKFSQILDIDPIGRTARVQPGVRNISISEAAAPHGLYYAPDPSSQIACTIGGNVAENSGGVHCLKYGLTVHNILKLQIVTMEGEMLEIGSDALDSAGFDLLALMTGSEGLLGVIVEVTVKLLPIPEHAQVLLAAFDDVESAGEAVGAIIAKGVIPAGLELMDNPAIRAAEDFVHANYPVDAAAILLCELDGAQDDVSDQITTVDGVLRSCGATEVRVARTAAERATFWAGRKAAFPAVGRLSPDYYCMDGTIPRKELGRVLQRMAHLATQYDLRVVNVFHAGDGNLHPLILYDANVPGELQRTEELGGRILELCVEVGGTITGEHGVGIEKINQMCVQFAAAELSQFHAVKHAFDVDGLLNPGKAVPTLQRCAEFGAMHVHHGNLKHPELERF
jgi:glycolate oxidase